MSSSYAGGRRGSTTIFHMGQRATGERSDTPARRSRGPMRGPVLRRRVDPRVGVVALLTSLAVASGGAVGQTARSGEAIAGDLREALAAQRGGESVEFVLDGDEVTLRGRVANLWIKSRLVESALEVDGVETVASELEIPAVEDDNELAREVGQAIARYPYYTVWDYVDGRVVDGVVALDGSVAPGRNKVRDLFERTAKIAGVQDIQIMIETQPTSGLDRALRQRLAFRIFTHEHFSDYSRMATPPFHILVHSGRVRLRGLIRNDLEKRLLEQIVRQTSGVLDVGNELGTGW